MARMEQTIISNLQKSLDYCSKVSPYIDLAYFSEIQERTIVGYLIGFFKKYHTTPSLDAVKLMAVNDTSLDDHQCTEIQEYVNDLPDIEPNLDWLVNETEKFCKEKAVYNALLKSVSIVDGKDKALRKEAIPSILQTALSVGFDTKIGHDYLADSDIRFEYYHSTENKVSFGIYLLDKISSGGMSDSSLTIVVAGTGVGKSLVMCSIAAAALRQGKNVLYITLEMADWRIAERIDANLLDLTMDEMKVVDKNIFNIKVNRLKSKTQGHLIIKEYPTASAHTGHFRALIEEIKLKRGITPDLIVVDYLGICASERIKPGSGANSYSYIKSVAEELRGLGMEYGIPVLSASQVNRTGYVSSDPGLEDIADSFGIAATADLCFMLVSDELLEAKNQLMIKQLKNRYADPAYYRKFLVGCDRSHMRMFDLEPSAQSNLSDSGQDKVVPHTTAVPSTFEGFKFS